ncbi:hypothetical protein [Lactobacillus sp.]|uniref:hypothetical protein n=1 Tax=Lactobacillus sp. TaxID=1591 RepID=UPI003F041E83
MNKLLAKATIALALVATTGSYAVSKKVFAETYTRTYIDSDGLETTETSSVPFTDDTETNTESSDSSEATNTEKSTVHKKGWSTNESGDKVYYLSNGQKATGYKTIKGKRYHFEKDGSATVGVSLKYIYGRNGRVYRYSRSKRGNHTVAAQKIAKTIVKAVGHEKGDTDLKRAGLAAYYVYCFYQFDGYSMKKPYYNTAYGVFINRYCSCAGTADATQMVLKYMGMKSKHVYRNKFHHQWCTLRLDGKKGWVDGMIGAAGYGSKWGERAYDSWWDGINKKV